jgi:hypothetical protein
MASAQVVKAYRSLREGFRWSGVRVDMRLLETSLTGFLVGETAPPFRTLLYLRCLVVAREGLHFVLLKEFQYASRAVYSPPFGLHSGDNVALGFFKYAKDDASSGALLKGTAA